MHNVAITKQVSIAMTAEDWDLYTTSYDCREAAAEINEAIETAFNAGKPRDQVTRAALAAMRKHANLGAMDSEPISHLEDLLDLLFS